MTKNNLLNLAIVLFKVFQSFYVLGFVVLTILFVHIQVEGDFYKDKILTIEKASISYTSSVKVDSENKGLTMDKMNTASLYITYLRISCLFVLLFLATREFEKIMKSVRNLSTFQDANFNSFRRIGRYALIYFFVASFYTYEFSDIGYSGFNISFTPLIVMLFAFIMAEIFKEGSTLLEDKELTI